MAYTVLERIGGFDNNGVFNRVENWVSDRNSGIKILAESMDLECDNFAAGLNKCITRDMKGKIEADFDFNDYATKNLGGDYEVSDSAATLEMLLNDKTRLFYDTGADSTHIVLYNSYITNPDTFCDDDGFHFYMLLTHGMIVSSQFVDIRFSGAPSINRELRGGDGGYIAPPGLSANSLYECILLTNLEGNKCIYVIGGLGSGGGGEGKVDEVVAGDETIIVDSSDPYSPEIFVNPSAVVKTICLEPPIDGNVQVVKKINDRSPGIDGKIALTINKNATDSTGDWPYIVQEINGRPPNILGNFTGVCTSINGMEPVDGNFDHIAIKHDVPETKVLNYGEIQAYLDKIDIATTDISIIVNAADPIIGPQEDSYDLPLYVPFSGQRISITFNWNGSGMGTKMPKLNITASNNNTFIFSQTSNYLYSIRMGGATSNNTIIVDGARLMAETNWFSIEDNGCNNTFLLNKGRLMWAAAGNTYPFISTQRGGKVIIDNDMQINASMQGATTNQTILKATGASIYISPPFRNGQLLYTNIMNNYNSTVVIQGQAVDPFTP
jgi:hypothetical protein